MGVQVIPASTFGDQTKSMPVAMVYVNLPLRGSPTSNLKAAVMATLVMSLYELVQPWIPGRVFDANDLVASLLGGLFAYLLLTVTDHLCAPEQATLADEGTR